MIRLTQKSDPLLREGDFVLPSSLRSFEIKFGAFLRYVLLIMTFSLDLKQSLFLSSLIIRAIGNAERKTHQNKLLPHFCIIETIFCNYPILFKLIGKGGYNWSARTAN